MADLMSRKADYRRLSNVQHGFVSLGTSCSGYGPDGFEATLYMRGDPRNYQLRMSLAEAKMLCDVLRDFIAGRETVPESMLADPSRGRKGEE